MDWIQLQLSLITVMPSWHVEFKGCRSLATALITGKYSWDASPNVGKVLS